MLSESTKELIAIGSAITANCQPCLQYHHAAAKQLGLDDADILEAVNVGKAVRKGAIAKMDKFIPTLLEQPVTAPIHDAECGCGDSK